MQFGNTLAAKMKERDVSVRKLAATWRPSNPESGRRNLHKYLRGQEPTQRIVEEIAAALDVPAEDLMEDAAEEEEDAAAMVHRLLLEVQALSAKIEKAEKRKRSAA